MAGVMRAPAEGGNRQAVTRSAARHIRYAVTRGLPRLAVIAVSVAAVTAPLGIAG